MLSPELFSSPEFLWSPLTIHRVKHVFAGVVIESVKPAMFAVAAGFVAASLAGMAIQWGLNNRVDSDAR